MDEFIHWPKPYLLLSATCDELLSWMIGIWMKNYLASYSNCNNVDISSPKKVYKEWEIMLSWHLVLVTKLELTTLNITFSGILRGCKNPNLSSFGEGEQQGQGAWGKIMSSHLMWEAKLTECHLLEKNRCNVSCLLLTWQWPVTLMKTCQSTFFFSNWTMEQYWGVHLMS